MSQFTKSRSGEIQNQIALPDPDPSPDPIQLRPRSASDLNTPRGPTADYQLDPQSIRSTEIEAIVNDSLKVVSKALI